MCSLNIGPGWNISQQGLNLITQGDVIKDRNIILKNALSADIKEIGSPVLNKESNKNHISELVLQIQKIRNVAAPKANEDSNAAPRMLKLTLTDGDTFVQAIETSNIPFISRDKTPPGSKVLLQNVRIQNGFLCLNQNNTKLLGGNVPHLFEKWELAKSVQHHSRNVASADGPPAWVNFGVKILNFGDDSKLSDSNTIKDQVKENTEFDTLRKDAIAEAATGAVKKVFGASAKLSNTAPRIDTHKPRNGEGKQFNKNKREPKSPKETDVIQKPSDKVSLFDFLEDKLQIVESSVSVKPKQDEVNGKYSQKPFYEERKSYNNDKNHSYHKNSFPKKEYGHNDKRNGSDFRNNHEFDNVSHNNFQKQPSFHRDTESYRSNLKNRDHVNYSRGYGYDQPKYSNETTTGIDTSNYSSRNNPKEYPVKKVSSTKYHNDSSRNSHDPPPNSNNKKIDFDHSNVQKDNKTSKRNEEEKINDSWHYRAPNISGQEQKKCTNSMDNLSDHMVKMSVGGEFASRSLRQHLNLQVKKPNPSRNTLESSRNNDTHNFNEGDDCLAKYWEDDKFYPARITASTDTTYVVQFKGYGNIEEVLKSDCTPYEHDRGEKKNYHKGTLEFRRNPKKFVSS